MLLAASASPTGKIFSGWGLTWMPGHGVEPVRSLSTDLGFQQFHLAACFLPQFLIQEASFGHGDPPRRN
jgi:hypothetical protein